MSQRHPRAFERRETHQSEKRETLPAVDFGSFFSVEVREEATQTWVTAAGELDLSTADVFDRCLWETQTPARRVVLDLRQLTFIDSAGLRSVAVARLRSVRWNHRLEVLSAPGQVRRMLSVSGFDELIEITDASALRISATQARGRVIDETTPVAKHESHRPGLSDPQSGRSPRSANLRQRRQDESASLR